MGDVALIGTYDGEHFIVERIVDEKDVRAAFPDPDSWIDDRGDQHQGRSGLWSTYA